MAIGRPCASHSFALIQPSQKASLGEADTETLRLLDHADKFRGIEQIVGRSSIEPGEGPAHPVAPQLLTVEISLINIGDLEFTARRWLEIGDNIDHLLIVELEAGHGPVGLQLERLVLNGRCAVVVIELDDAVTLGANLIGNTLAPLFCRNVCQTH